MPPPRRSEVGILLSTALLSCAVRQVSAPSLLDELVLFLLDRQSLAEPRADTESHTLRFQLIQRCDHISDEVRPEPHVIQREASLKRF